MLGGMKYVTKDIYYSLWDNKDSVGFRLWLSIVLIFNYILVRGYHSLFLASVGPVSAWNIGLLSPSFFSSSTCSLCLSTAGRYLHQKQWCFLYFGVYFDYKWNETEMHVSSRTYLKENVRILKRKFSRTKHFIQVKYKNYKRRKPQGKYKIMKINRHTL